MSAGSFCVLGAFSSWWIFSRISLISFWLSEIRFVRTKVTSGGRLLFPAWTSSCFRADPGPGGGGAVEVVTPAGAGSSLGFFLALTPVTCGAEGPCPSEEKMSMEVSISSSSFSDSESEIIVCKYNA